VNSIAAGSEIGPLAAIVYSVPIALILPTDSD